MAIRASVEADGDRDTSAMAQPVLALLRHIISGPYGGMVLNPAAPNGRAVLPKALLERMVEEVDPDLRIKTALCGERTDATASAVVDAVVADAPMWIAVNQTEEGGPMGVAESRSATGERYLSRSSPTPSSCSLSAAAISPSPSARSSSRRRWPRMPGSTGILVDPAVRGSDSVGTSSPPSSPSPTRTPAPSA